MNNNTNSFETAIGQIDYTMTNDFIFRALLQRNKEVLTALICALLHLPTDSVDAEITNPIYLGAAFSNKDFILDIRVDLNGKRLVDLEMQLVNQDNWPERSISYAARSFDNLNRGEDYIKVKPVNSIGFLDFMLLLTPFTVTCDFCMRIRYAKQKSLLNHVLAQPDSKCPVAA